MVIEKVHGLRATAMSMDERFTLLAKAAPDRVAMRQQQQRRRNSMGALLAQNFNYGNRFLIEQIARRLEAQTKRQTIRQRLGVPQSALRRFGSESSLPRLRRSNSFGNLSQQSVKNRVSWRQSNGNLSRSASFSNLSSVGWRNFRRRGSGQRQIRGRVRGRGMNTGVGRITRAQFRAQQRPQASRGAKSRGTRGRGGVTRNQPQKTLTKEELDKQLDQYMAGTKAALDLELDNYMKNAMDLE